MKKQFFLLVILLVGGVFFSALKDKEVKACDMNKPASSSAVMKKCMKQTPAEYIEDADASFNMFMNPFRQI